MNRALLVAQAFTTELQLAMARSSFTSSVPVVIGWTGRR